MFVNFHNHTGLHQLAMIQKLPVKLLAFIQFCAYYHKQQIIHSTKLTQFTGFNQNIKKEQSQLKICIFEGVLKLVRKAYTFYRKPMKTVKVLCCGQFLV